MEKTFGKEGDSAEGGDDEIPNILSKKQSYEPQIGGFSLNSVIKSENAFYFFLIIAGLGGVIYYGK